MASRYDFVQSGKDKNKLITNRAEWAGITVDKDDTDPRDKDTLIKTLIDLKDVCIAAEKTNRKLRAELDRGQAALIQSGMRDRQANARPEQRARLFGNFAFKDKNQPAPQGGRERAHARGTSVAPDACATAGAGEGRQARSPALLKLLSTDHLQFRDFSRGMLLEDVQLLTRYQQKLEAETKQLKLEAVRMKRNQQQVDSRVGAPSRPLSAPSARNRPFSQTAAAKLSAVDRVEQECHIALKLASVLDQIQKDKREDKAAGPQAAGRVTSGEVRAAEQHSQARPECEAEEVAQAATRRAVGEAGSGADLPQSAEGASASALSPGGVSPVFYDILIRNGTCRNAGTEAEIWMTARGDVGSMPLVYLNGKQQSASVRLVSPLMLDLAMTTSAKRQQVLADARLRDAIIAAVARTAQVASKFVDISKVDEMATQHGAALSQVAIRLQVVGGAEEARRTVAALAPAALVEAWLAAKVPSPAVLRPAGIASAPFYERGSVLHLQVVSPLGHIGELEAVDIGHDGANSADAWFCQDMLVRPSTQADGWTLFPCHRWIKASAATGAPARASLLASLEDAQVVDGIARSLLRGAPLGPHRSLVVYELFVTTGSVRGSGTSSNVYVDILGSEGSCLDCKLEEDERDFQTGSTCKFVVVGAAVGQPRALVFRVDLAGFSPSWLLKEAELHLKGKHGQARDPEDDEGLEGRCWRAKADTWLSQQGKTQLEVPLVPVDDRPSSPVVPMATAAAAAKAPARAPIDCVPSEFCCMLSGAPMRRPVVAADGHTYEKEEMEARFRQNLLTSPMTNQPLSDLKLVPNRALEALMAKY